MPTAHRLVPNNIFDILTPLLEEEYSCSEMLRNWSMAYYSLDDRGTDILLTII